MRVEERKETKTIEVVNKVYIANDGKEFDNEKKCQDYEFVTERKKLLDDLKPYILPLDDIPINTDSVFSDNNTYRYFIVPNVEILEKISALYDNRVCTNKEVSFPTVVAVEEDYDYTYSDGVYGEVYDYYLDQMERITKSFFSKLGIEVEFKEVCYEN